MIAGYRQLIASYHLLSLSDECLTFVIKSQVTKKTNVQFRYVAMSKKCYRNQRAIKS